MFKVFRKYRRILSTKFQQGRRPQIDEFKANEPKTNFDFQMEVDEKLIEIMSKIDEIPPERPPITSYPRTKMEHLKPGCFIELDKESQFSDILNFVKFPLFVVFSAQFCEDIYDILRDRQREIPDKFGVVKVNEPDFVQLAEETNIRIIPTVLLFLHGKLLVAKFNTFTKEEAIDMLDRAFDVMNEEKDVESNS